MVVFLRAQGHTVNRKRVQRLMLVLGLAGMAPGPATSQPHPEHQFYPYRLRGEAKIRRKYQWMQRRGEIITDAERRNAGAAHRASGWHPGSVPATMPIRWFWIPHPDQEESAMTQLTLEMPEEVFATLRKSPQEFTHELRIAAAVKWYELELVSQGRAAEIAGLTRADFITALGKYQVSPFQYSAEEVLEDLAGVD